jgi:uncharacterized membrane protein YphA (DoxX/SURF4 family)
MTAVLLVAQWILRILLAAFFVFVGYWKAFGPIEALAEHGAWVAGFPAWFARAVGWSEIIAGAALLAAATSRTRNVAQAAAAYLVLNQLVALGVHLSRGEVHAVPQNLILIVLLALLFFAGSRRPGT